MAFKKLRYLAAGLGVGIAAYATYVYWNLEDTVEDDPAIVLACAEMALNGFRPLAESQTDRYEGKARDATLRCRGGQKAMAFKDAPWVDWSNYWGTGGSESLSDRFGPGSHIFNRSQRGLEGALLDLEYQRMELIKFNLFDNETYETYSAPGGSVYDVWPEMRLPEVHRDYDKLEVMQDGTQVCSGDLVRFRNVSGICNDVFNPGMGAAGKPFARNMAFEATFPDSAPSDFARNRHGDRLGSLAPDPQLISRLLMTREQTDGNGCNGGKGTAQRNDAKCDYQEAPFFNVLAAFWIQFMTHDWFSHLDNARNDTSRLRTDLGCHGDMARALGCRPEDQMEAALYADTDEPGTFDKDGRTRLTRAPKVTTNFVTAWWDASQIYGWDDPSRARVRRDPEDPARLLLTGDPGDLLLPLLRAACSENTTVADCDPKQPEWAGQEAVAFPDNWSLGLSFYHNLFAREHNAIIDAFREAAVETPDADSGLRHPDRPDETITYAQISDDELFEIARLIVAAEIAKIHTIEWTTQLLYNEPMHEGMNSNWSGLFKESPLMAEVSERLVKRLQGSDDSTRANQLYSALAAGAGIVGRGSEKRFPPYVPKWASVDRWRIDNPGDLQAGVNHFGSPFNFPEEFPSVYRLHALVPDMMEYRDLSADPNAIQEWLPIVDTFRGAATPEMRSRGLANMALTMGRQRLGLLLLKNHPQFLQNLDLRPRLDTQIDVVALDIIRDRERGVPRFNEFRRQIGLRQLTSLDDFIDVRLPSDSPERARQQELVDLLREVYGQHVCDDSLVITDAQLDPDGKPITDCLGHADGTLVDNIEDVDLLVGFHAETTRPHGFAISETQFHIFILNASRRLFSDRFFTSSFRPEIYTHLGIRWVMENGPTGPQWEDALHNGHKQEVSPMKRVLLRAIPELEGELATVMNAFDPWARDRGAYYSLAWKPRPGAESDPAFSE